MEWLPIGLGLVAEDKSTEFSYRCLKARYQKEEDDRKHGQEMEREAQRQKHERQQTSMKIEHEQKQAEQKNQHDLEQKQKDHDHQLKLKDKEIELAQIELRTEQEKRSALERQLALEMLQRTDGKVNEEQKRAIEKLIDPQLKAEQGGNDDQLEQYGACAIDYNCK